MPRRGWGTLGGAFGALGNGSYPSYHVILGGTGLMLAQGGYVRSKSRMFAAKLSTSGTSSDDLLGEQTLALNDWSGGEGKLKHDGVAPVKYRAGSGLDVHSEEGAIALGPHMTLRTAQGANDMYAIAVVQNELFVGGSGGVVYSTSDGVTFGVDFSSGKTSGITALMRFGTDVLWAGNGEDGSVYQHETSVGWTTRYTLPDCNGIRAMATHFKSGVRYVYLGADRIGNAASVYWSDGSLAAPTLLGRLDEERVDVMIVYRSSLVVVANDHTHRRTNIYTISNGGDPGSGLSQVQALEGLVLQCGAVVGDALYLGDKAGGRIWKWDGSHLDLFHDLGTPAAPYTAPLRGMANYRGALWISVIQADGTPGLLRYDADKRAWSRPVTGLAGSVPDVIAEYKGQLYVTTGSSGTARVYSSSDTFASTGYLESGLIDAGLDGVNKTWIGVEMSHSALVSPQSVKVEYKLEDTGSWVTLGTSSTVGATSAGFDFVHGVTSELIAFKITLAGTAGSSTPLRLNSLTIRYLPLPEALREWDLRVQMRGTTVSPQKLADGTDDILQGEEISEAIWSLIDNGSSAAFLDIDRQEYTVDVTDWSEHLHPASLELQADTIGWELEGTLHLRERSIDD